MHWPTESERVPLTELGTVNTIFMSTCKTPYDPMVQWGTSFCVENLNSFIARQQKALNLLVSPAHVLLLAVTDVIRAHPEFNRRIVGRRAVALKGINLVMPILQTRTGEIDYAFLRSTEEMTLSDIVQRMWEEACDKTDLAQRDDGDSDRRYVIWLSLLHKLAGWAFALVNHFRIPDIPYLHVANGATAMVNYISYPNGPPMSTFVPSCLPMNSCLLNVTMGPAADRVVAENGKPVVRRVAPLFVRADHRIVDTRHIARFVGTLRELLTDPARLSSACSP